MIKKQKRGALKGKQGRSYADTPLEFLRKMICQQLCFCASGKAIKFEPEFIDWGKMWKWWSPVELHNCGALANIRTLKIEPELPQIALEHRAALDGFGYIDMKATQLNIS